MSDQKQPQPLTWVVTGCSSGIGEALVRAILDKGDQVIATARPRDGVSGGDRLSALKDAGAAVFELDVSSSQEELDTKAREIWEIFGKVDVLVNNAGYIDAGIFEEITESFLINAIRTNALGPLNLTRAFLPLMRARQSGTVLFSSTVGVYYGAPGASSYTGGKGLLETVVPNLALELAPFGIRTSLLTYGYFRTEVMAPGNIHYRAPRQLPEYAEMNRLVAAGCAASNHNQSGDPAKAAAVVVEAVKGTGRWQGKQLPLRLPIGKDAISAIRKACEERLAICAELEGIVDQTDL
ncbi:NAD(P)-binding protein [Aspergillus brunneoviolaceus CBS 621.78]|uniref:NAD(P)-binding protein n=1 Tax=Aspergillus brunneoviolaceus CBS 621.78 TaxID=1450534 RepID=A0ACD1GH33_9EURO|nr:NAD(P)-binding protein [Aspergillus brunneoviolaceus CBS 621.78]RAH48568.1 NAD(P)-binding protein [Aspergillus brunneoviolaceus CBS 621.78]